MTAVSPRIERKKTGGTPRRGAAPEAIAAAVAIILKENRVLVTRRKVGSHLEGAWEFPGGTIQAGEKPEKALRREIEEELAVRIGKATLFHRKCHSYLERDVDIHFYLCTGIVGEPTGAEGQETRWVSAGDLAHLPTPAANADVIRMLQDQIG